MPADGRPHPSCVYDGHHRPDDGDGSFAGLDTSGGGFTGLGTTVTRPNETITNPSVLYAVTWGFGSTNQMPAPNYGTWLCPDGGYNTDIALASGTTAVGFDIFHPDTATTVYGSVTTSIGTTAFSYAALLPSAGSASYIGFVETMAGVTILSVDTAIGTGAAFGFSNLSLHAVPEPSGLVLSALPLAGLSAYAWRKRR